MNLLFFDIECAGVYKTVAKICAFGYVLCDEQFNTIEKEDILINPLGKFHLTSPRGDGLVLPYAEDEFNGKPPFPKVYKRIKQLLENPENIVTGHATVNDVRYLNLETKRFKLPSFEFSFADSQLMFMSLKNDFSHQFGLEHIAVELGVEFTPHRAADDAYATMRVVQAMCREQNCTMAQLMDYLGFKPGRISNYAVQSPSSGAGRAYVAKRNADKLEKSRIRNEFFKHITRRRPRVQGKLNGKVFSFSRAIEDDLEISRPFVDKIYSLGGKYAQQLSRANVYVICADDKSGRAKKAQSDPAISVIDVDSFKELLND